MAEVTLEKAKEMYQLWLDAEVAVSTGQSYTVGTRSLSMVDLDKIRSAQEYWLDKIEELESGQKGIRVRYLHPTSF